MKRIILNTIIIFSITILSGCNFLTPEDDLNGNNLKKEEFVKKLDSEKNESLANQGNAQQTQQQQAQQAQQIQQTQANPVAQNTPTPDPVKKEDPQIDPETENKNSEYSEKYKKATIVTNYGEIKVEFFNEDAPLTVGNFTRLAEEKFYDETKFHRVMEGFMIQGGDPNSKDDNWMDDGTGGPGYKFNDEINDNKLVRGSLAMANSGVNTNGSQFFIVTSAETPHLDGKHTNFGKVFEGMDVVDKIEKVKTNDNDHPEEDVIIKEIRLR